VEVLITNMMGCEAYEVDLFKELYYLRWGIEENYKRLKQWVEIENTARLEILSAQQGLNKFALKSKLYINAIRQAFDELQQLKSATA
jgi:IS4 transposase